jgi:hypothetical protein
MKSSDLFDEDDLFGDARLQGVVYAASGNRRPIMPKPNKVMQSEGAPLGWICNASTIHGDTMYRYNLRGTLEFIEAPCRCSKCLQEKHGLVEGPVWSKHPTFTEELLRKRGYVGLYDYSEIYTIDTTCAVCHKQIPLDCRVISFDPVRDEVVHAACVDEEPQHGFSVILRKRVREKSPD